MNNLSEEEKKAIEFLKGVCTDDCVSRPFIVEPIVNLINKQQKEIEETNTELERTSHLLWLCNSRFEKISRLLGLTDSHTGGYLFKDIYKEIEELKKENIELIDQKTDGFWENDRLERKIEKLQQKTINYDKTLERLQKDTISKDKIRAKIKELEEEMKAICEKEGCEDYQTEEFYKIQSLKELLEE